MKYTWVEIGKYIFIFIYSAFVPELYLEMVLEQVFTEGEFQQETELSLWSGERASL